MINQKTKKNNKLQNLNFHILEFETFVKFFINSTLNALELRPPLFFKYSADDNFNIFQKNREIVFDVKENYNLYSLFRNYDFWFEKFYLKNNIENENIFFHTRFVERDAKLSNFISKEKNKILVCLKHSETFNFFEFLNLILNSSNSFIIKTFSSKSFFNKKIKLSINDLKLMEKKYPYKNLEKECLKILAKKRISIFYDSSIKQIHLNVLLTSSKEIFNLIKIESKIINSKKVDLVEIDIDLIFMFFLNLNNIESLQNNLL